MKILFVIRSLGYGGAERQLVALAGALHKRGHQVQVAVYYPGGPLETDLKAAGVPLYSLDKGGRWETLGFLARLIQLLRREKPDVLHSYLEGANTLCALLKPRLGGVRLIWGVRGSEMELNRYDWLTALFYRLERRLAGRADRIIANSHIGRDDAVAHGFPAAKIVVVPNGIDVHRFCPDAVGRQRLRAEWGVTAQQTLIGRIGRFDPMKDWPGFLRAAAHLAQERADLRFVCVGDGPARASEALHTLSRELGMETQLRWTGPRRDMPAIYSALDLMVSSSAYGEGFPNVVGEAMACGVPCVVTSVGDAARIVADIGVAVPPNDPQALAAGCREALAADRCERAARGRNRIVTEFSVERLVERTEQALWHKD